MTTREEPLDPEEVLAAAEAAHLAARRAGAASTPNEDEDPSSPRASADDSGRPEQTDRPGRSTGPDRPGGPGRAGRTWAGRGRAPLPLAAAIAAGWAAAVSLAPVAVVVVLLQAAESGTAAVADSLRTAALGWLLGHGVPVTTEVGRLSLAPLALTALAAWRVARAGVHVTRAMGARNSRSPRQAAVAAAAVAVAYGVLGVATGFIVDSPQWSIAPVRSGVTLAAFGFLAAGYGAARATGVAADLVGRVPVLVRDGARCGLVAVVTLLAAGAAMAGIAVAAAGDRAAETLAAYRTGVAGLSGLVLLCLAYAPNLAVWAVSYLVGPGFAVGTGTVVRGSDVALGSLPPLPVFAGLPQNPLPTVGATLLLVPVLAGGVAGWLLARSGGSRARSGPRRGQELGWVRLAGGAVVSGVVGGLLLGVAAAASGGSLGGGHLAAMGPTPLLVGLFSVATLTVGALLGAGLTAGFARH